MALIIILIGLATLDLVHGDSFSNQFKRNEPVILSYPGLSRVQPVFPFLRRRGIVARDQGKTEEVA